MNNNLKDHVSEDLSELRAKFLSDIFYTANSTNGKYLSICDIEELLRYSSYLFYAYNKVSFCLSIIHLEDATVSAANYSQYLKIWPP